MAAVVASSQDGGRFNAIPALAFSTRSCASAGSDRMTMMARLRLRVRVRDMALHFLPGAVDGLPGRSDTDGISDGAATRCSCCDWLTRASDVFLINNTVTDREVAAVRARGVNVMEALRQE